VKVFQTRFSDSQLSSVTKVIKSGEIGFGPNVTVLEQAFREKQSRKHHHYIATNSASASAYMIFSYLKEKYGSCDVYTPSLGFTSPAWAAQHFGHRIIWVDVDDNLIFDVSDFKKKAKSRCKRYLNDDIKPVVMPILYGGVSDIKGWKSLGSEGYGEIRVVDSAHGITPVLESDFIFFSFHPFKPIASSDGGMIGTSDDEANNYFLSYRNFGRSNINGTYDITQQGFKFYMNNLNATLALESLCEYENNLMIRCENYQLWEDLLGEHQCVGNLVKHDHFSSFYFATWISRKDTSEICKHTGLSKHYPLLHKTEFFNELEAVEHEELSNSVKLHKHIINLPLHSTTLGDKISVIELL
tara:strand:- start:3310 stop:4377 length:1068 start_codon:yes stop_codon:yes gene_type:complete